MKKTVCLCLIGLILLTGCRETAPERETECVPSRVPDMTVSDRNDSFVVGSGNYSWTGPGVNGEMCAVVACGSHPLDDLHDREFRHVTGKTLTLSFQFPPDSITVYRWEESDLGNMDAQGELVMPEDMQFPLETGNWVYQIIATWNGDGWGGRAEYHLYVTNA